MPDPSPTPGTYVAPTVTITGTPQQTPTVQVAQASSATDSGMFGNPWTWAVLALGAAAIVVARSKHPPRWARKMGLHR